MRRIFYLTCALIAYGSLYPFALVPRESPLGVLAVFAASLHPHIDRGSLRDILLNLIIYIPVGFFYVLDERQQSAAWKRCLKATLAGAALSLCMETLQYWVEFRSPSLLDLLTNTISAAAGAVVGVIFGRRAHPKLDALPERVLGHPSAALFLLMLWAAAFFTPGDWNHPGAIAHIKSMLRSPQLGPGHVFVSATQWLGIGALAAAVVGRKGVMNFLLIAGLTLPARFLVPGQHPELHDFAGLAVALLAWGWPALERRIDARTVGLLLAAGLCAEGLRPWHFSSTAFRFEWVPFISMLGSSDWAPMLLVLFRKAALYGTVVWAVARAGLGMLGAAAFSGVLLGILELAQIFLPGRTAETTDPILAVILGLILLHFDRKFGADQGSGAAQPAADGPATPVFASAPASSHPAMRPIRPASAPGASKNRPAGPGIWTGGRRTGL